MAAGREARGKLRHRAKRALPPRDTGTPETRRKLKADVMLRLLRQGRIGAEHFSAASDIAEAFQALERCLLPTRQAAVRVFCSRQAMVMGPTPPGTGVMAPATRAQSS